MIENAQAAIERALALDGQLAEAYTTLGSIEHNRNDYKAAEAAFKRSLELNPNYVTAYHWYAVLLRQALGRRDEALELIKKAAGVGSPLANYPPKRRHWLREGGSV